MSPPFDSEIMATMHNVSTIHEIKVNCRSITFVLKERLRRLESGILLMRTCLILD